MAQSVFSGPLDQHPFFQAQHEAAKNVARTTAALGHPAGKAAPVKAAPRRNASVVPFAAKPAQRQLPGSPFGKLPSTALAGAPKLAKAFAKVPVERPQPSPHELFMRAARSQGGLALPALGVVEGVASSVAKDVPKEFQGTGAFDKASSAAGATLGSVVSQTSPMAFLPGMKGGAKVAGQYTKEAVDLPSQALPMAYQLGKANMEKSAGALSTPGMRRIEMGLQEGAVGKLVRGKPIAAAEQAAKAPLQTQLELSGAGSLVDRGMGTVSKAVGADSAPITAAEGSVTSRPGMPLTGNAVEPQPPYSKGYFQNMIQRNKDANLKPPSDSAWRTLTKSNLSAKVKTYVHKLEGKFHGTMRQVRANAEKVRADAIRAPRTIHGTQIPGVDAVNLYNRGILPNPAFTVGDRVANGGEAGRWGSGNPVDPSTPAVREQLSQLAEHHATPNPHEATLGKDRLAAQANAQGLLNDPQFAGNMGASYDAAKKMAADKRLQQPTFERLGIYSPQQMRGAKLADAFQWHLRGQDPWVDGNPPLNTAGVKHDQATTGARDALEARRTSLSELHEAEVRHGNAEITGADLKAVQDAHAANVAAHKEAVKARDELAPKAPGEHQESPFSIAAPKPLPLPPDFHDRLEQARIIAKYAPSVDKIRKLRALAERAGTPPEALAAGKKAGRLEHKIGFSQYDHIPPSIQADKAVASLEKRLADSERARLTPRIHLSMDQVAKELEKRGVSEDQLAFISNRPHTTFAGQMHMPVGTARGGAGAAQGFRSGKAFLDGHYDPTHDGMAKQYISDAQRIERETQNTIIDRELGLTKEHTAKLYEDQIAKGKVLPEHLKEIEARMAGLRSGTTFISPKVHKVEGPDGVASRQVTRSAWQQAQAHAEELHALNPEVRLVPFRVASPYASAMRLDQIARDVSPAHVHDLMSPNIWNEDHGNLKFSEPDSLDKGEVGLMHADAAKTLQAYEKAMGSKVSNSLGNISALWRKQNVAWSTKHPLGIMQELGIRALTNGVGLGTTVRGYRALKEFAKAAKDPAFRTSNPEIDHILAGYEEMAGGTVIKQTMDQQNRGLMGIPGAAKKYDPLERLAGTPLGKLGDALESWESHKITGVPARLLSDLGKGYMKTTNKILQVERKGIEKPFATAFLGKALNDEAKALTGKKIPLFKAMDSVMQDFIKGRFNPRSLDYAASRLHEFAGDFETASQKTRVLQVVSPFWTWYRNALKFIYHTLPARHPIKTGILAALVGATEEQRKAEGQGYQPGLKLNPNELEAGQQGSVPSPFKKGSRWEAQYYTPEGAVSKGFEGLGEAFNPILGEPLQLLKGVNSFGTPLKGKPEGVERGLLVLGSLFESFNPVVRKIKDVVEGKAGKAFSPVRDNPSRSPAGALLQSGEGSGVGEGYNPGSSGGSGGGGEGYNPGASGNSSGGGEAYNPH